MNFHQIWIGENKLKDPNELSNSWVEKNNNLKCFLWNDDSISKLLKQKYGKIYELYLQCPLLISKIDLARLVILYEFGGIYADVDTFCLEEIPNYLFENDLVISEMHFELQGLFYKRLFGMNPFHRFLNNGILFAKPKCPFLYDFLFHLLSCKIPENNYENLNTYGPIGLSKFYYDYHNKSNIKIKILQYEYFESPTKLSDSLALHYHTALWDKKNAIEKSFDLEIYYMNFLICLFLIICIFFWERSIYLFLVLLVSFGVEIYFIEYCVMLFKNLH